MLCCRECCRGWFVEICVVPVLEGDYGMMSVYAGAAHSVSPARATSRIRAANYCNRYTPTSLERALLSAYTNQQPPPAPVRYLHLYLYYVLYTFLYTSFPFSVIMFICAFVIRCLFVRHTRTLYFFSLADINRIARKSFSNIFHFVHVVLFIVR